MVNRASSLDEMVVVGITQLFPNAKTPDADNYLTSGLQHKAPDHEVMGGALLVERKTLNAVDDSQFYEKLVKIAARQGKPFRGYGRLSSASVIRGLPDPDAASRGMTDFTLNQLKKSVGEARKQFDSHLEHVGEANRARLVTILDQSEVPTFTDWIEYFIGNLFVKQRNRGFNAGLIDSIVYIKHPSYVLSGENSYWFKCLIKKEAAASATERILMFSQCLHDYLNSNHLVSFVPKFEGGRYRALVA